MAQQEPVWDDTQNRNWGEAFHHIRIPSSADSNFQDAWFYRSSKKTAQPLIISLHTWSGNYDQEDPLSKEILLRDWNYIHPDFRGVNNTPEACGSPLVISDLQDAIRYAVKNANVDTANIHIIGVSGGGYAALLAYMLLDYPVKSFNAWAPISDLQNWYWESKGRHNKYAGDIEKAASVNGILNLDELKKRSPVFSPVPFEKRKNAVLHIYEGVHDGYTGSVPISHALLFYNKIVTPLYPGAVIPDSMIASLITKQCNPAADSLEQIGGRMIQLRKSTPIADITIFEGTHEMLVPQALSLIPVTHSIDTSALTILTLGDSNGAFETGWPQQLKKLLPFAHIINKSISGNTIGFDNLGREELNTIKNIDRYLDETYKEIRKQEKLDYIFINLGTNDAKQLFKDRQKEVADNMEQLLDHIAAWMSSHGQVLPGICLVTPSPMDDKKIDTLKYGGGNERIRQNIKKFRRIAHRYRAGFLNTYTRLNNNFSEKTTDGVHLNGKTQFELASMILDYIHQNK